MKQRLLAEEKPHDILRHAFGWHLVTAPGLVSRADTQCN